ncbi:VOC family protein [Pelomonas sp. SE-A7]|uniref:VOC family protein n=1 Tax=Pelomonas sp. SE-A7 TaxID=3054953 RepID=UPI00259CCB0B|nr:VOC family protein [Pelomonas sp. SE-A7]MDM4767469.1 VOC family protein [Pelomonas sp. SE-A7]
MDDSNPTPALGEIGQIAITVSDVGRALGFYRDVLGLQFLFSAGPNLAFLQAGGVRLMLSTPQGAGAVGENSVLYFRTASLETSFAALVTRGAKTDSPPHLIARMPDHELWMAFVRDPDDNLVGLMEERR